MWSVRDRNRIMDKNKNNIDDVRKESREKFGRFYYSDKVGMDWEKPEKQNVTGGIPENHNGFCIASDTIENFWIEKLQQVEQKKVEEIIDDIEKIKNAVRVSTGSFKYDSCYNDVLNLKSLTKK